MFLKLNATILVVLLFIFLPLKYRTAETLGGFNTKYKIERLWVYI